MAILRSLEGTFYDVPDSELDKFQVPPDQVKGLMESAGQKPPQGPKQQQQQQTFQVSGDASRGAPQILVQFITQATPSQQQQPQPQQQAQKPAGQGQEEQVDPQWYWVNWFNWANWYNWY
ncbi:MAG: hypothetical protein ABFD98_06710 [Syntrophobacteraceae bacterium]|nr:hypothetical protein [Desulfobacteraceae bacterium]